MADVSPPLLFSLGAPLEPAPAAPLAPQAPLAGTVTFLGAEARARTCDELQSGGAIVALVDAIAITSRGHLGSLVRDAVARGLSARGLRSTGAIETDVLRARRGGASGVAIVLGSLRALIDEEGALDAADSRLVRRLARATGELPLHFALDAADETLDAYGPAVPLGSLLGRTSREEEACADEVAASPDTANEADVPPPAELTPTPAESLPEATPAPPPRPKLSPETWRPWVIALTAARGPQPLAAFERLFSQAYMPLARAIEDGLDDTRAEQACEEFRRAFAHMYTDTCPTFAVTGKRPRMVFDAPDLASKLARLHGARTTQLLLVDGLRYDLGQALRDMLGRELAARASLADEQVLWSALPTTTARQLELLAHGVTAMRTAPESDRDAEPVRGRTAETIRRVKVGQRDVYKLDVVQAKLAENPGAEELEGAVTVACDAIARHAVTLSARTLLFVFGDHGFLRSKSGTLSQGGSSPEEVLVPAFAFLVGAVH